MSSAKFEVFLIQTMACDQGKRKRALDQLGVSHEAAEKIRKEVDDVTRLSPGQIDRLVDLLGEKAKVECVVEGEENATIVTCSFSTWPDLTYQVMGNQQGFWLDARFVRAPGVSVQMPSQPSELEIWKYTFDEVSRWFGPLEPGDSWSSFAEFGIRYSKGGEQYAYDAAFSWGLLQYVRPSS